MATTTKCAFCGKETHFKRMSMITFQDICVACREAEDEIYGTTHNGNVQPFCTGRRRTKIPA